MQYAILCYHDEKVTCACSKEEEDAVMAKLGVVMEKLTRLGKLGPAARLLPTTAATTLRKDREPALVGKNPWQSHGFARSREVLNDIKKGTLGPTLPKGWRPQRHFGASARCSSASSREPRRAQASVAECSALAIGCSKQSCVRHRA
jgi:hypothetical protein